MKRLAFKQLLEITVILLVSLTASLAGVSPVAGALPVTGVLPVSQAEYDFIYDRLERVDALTLDSYDYQLGPYRFDHEGFSFEPFDWLTTLPPDRIRLFGFIGEDFRAARESRAQALETIRGGFAGRPVSKLFVYGSFVLDEALAEDENYSGKKWRGLAGDVQEAFAHFRTGKIELTAGRFASFWGVRNSLIFSRENLFDGVAYTFRWGKLALSYRLARLDGLSPDIDGVDQFENRFLAAHRLDVHLSNHLRVGIFETVLFGGPGRQIDLFYLNPIIFFHGTQLNEGTNDNTTLGFDFSFKPVSGLKLYGQFLIDDLQIDNETQGDQEPAEIAFVVGGYAADLVVDGLDAELEYTRVTNWTFNQMLARNKYIFNGRPIGSVLGNDYDLFSFLLRRWFGNNTAIIARFGYYRQGECRVDAEWTSPWTQVDGDYSEPFPTGIVQETAIFSLGGKSFIGNFAFVDLQFGIDRVNNYSHRNGFNRTLPFAEFTLSVFFSQSVNLQ